MRKSYNEVLYELHYSCGIVKVMWMGKNWNVYTYLLEKPPGTWLLGKKWKDYIKTNVTGLRIWKDSDMIQSHFGIFRFCLVG